jgi:hypothetical protein
MPQPTAEPAAVSTAGPTTAGPAKPDVPGAVAPEAEPASYERLFIDNLSALLRAGNTDGGGKKGSSGSPVALARLVNLSRKLANVDQTSALFRQAYLATLALADPTSSSSVALIIDDLEFSTSRNSPIYVVMRGLAYSAAMLLGLGLIAFCILCLFAGLSSEGTGANRFVEATRLVMQTGVGSPLVIAVTFGTLGSIVSILLRLSEFEVATRRSPQFLMMTGFMLPLVGAVFASVSCALFASGIINFDFAATDHAGTLSNPHFYIVIGFLSGFSERFTRGLLGRAEDLVTAANKTEVKATDPSSGKSISVTRQAVETRDHGPGT